MGPLVFLHYKEYELSIQILKNLAVSKRAWISVQAEGFWRCFWAQLLLPSDKKRAGLSRNWRKMVIDPIVLFVAVLKIARKQFSSKSSF
jgi:hypothetical protein